MAGRQRGAVLLAILVFAGLIAVLLSVGFLRPEGSDASRDQVTQAALEQAKAALIDYAITYAESHDSDTAVPGFLPCPSRETVRDGAADPVGCGPADVNVIGRLPWYTLKLPPLRDGHGECLWYAVAGRYKASASLKTNEISNDKTTQTALLNWDTPGQLNVFTFNGANRVRLTPDNDYDRAVAIVFAPGPLFGAGGNRDPAPNTEQCGGNHVAANYLDTWTPPAPGVAIDNAALGTTPPAPRAQSDFVQMPRSATFNDRMIIITARELWSAIWRSRYFQDEAQNLVQKVAECIAVYPTTRRTAPACGTEVASPGEYQLPWPAPLDSSDSPDSLFYADEAGLTFGRVPFATPVSHGATGRCSGSLENDRLMGAPSIGGRCATWTTPRTDTWYANWKDHLFYGLSAAFRPNQSPAGCAPTDCVKVNGNAAAGVVIFAGPPLPPPAGPAGAPPAGQTRLGATDRSNLENYLEAPNLAAASAAGSGDFSTTGGTPFNDRLVSCIRYVNSSVPFVIQRGCVP